MPFSQEALQKRKFDSNVKLSDINDNKPFWETIK